MDGLTRPKRAFLSVRLGPGDAVPNVPAERTVREGQFHGFFVTDLVMMPDLSLAIDGNVKRDLMVMVVMLTVGMITVGMITVRRFMFCLSHSTTFPVANSAGQRLLSPRQGGILSTKTTRYGDSHFK
jgi:hypothetical protein